MAAQPATQDPHHQQAPTPLRTQVTLEEAARRLGVSPATVRRRAKRGQLRAVKRELPTGFQWFVELPPDVGEPATRTAQAATQDAQPATHDQGAEIRRLEEHVGDLRQRTEDQAREIAELHRLLANQQQLLLMAPQAANHEATQAANHLPTQEVATQVVSQSGSQAATQALAWPERRRWWQRLLWG